MNIARADSSSLIGCLEIARRVTLAPSRDLEHGFLLGRPDEAEYRRFVDERAIWVCRRSGDVLGFVVAFSPTSSLHQQIDRRSESTTWTRGYERVIETSIFIDKVATHPDHIRHGVARALYEHLFQEFPESSFLAGIAESPFANAASVPFHSRLGFRRVGTFHPGQFAGLSAYRSGIYFRPAQTR